MANENRQIKPTAKFQVEKATKRGQRIEELQSGLEIQKRVWSWRQFK